MRWLLAIDLHSQPEAVLNQAMKWATPGGHTVDLLFVDDTPTYEGLLADPAVHAVVATQRKRIVEAHKQRFDELFATLPEANRGQALFTPGDPSTTVCERAEGYDAVVVATHGRTGLRRFWMGSVAERIVRGSPVPVLVLRVPDDAQEG